MMWHRRSIETASGCPMCAMNPEIRIDSGADGEAWGQHFELFVNQYPYLDDQIIALDRVHRPVTPPSSVISLLEMLRSIHMASFAHQQVGSGASFPAHSHFAVTTERFAIFEQPYDTLLDCSEVRFETAFLPHMVFRMKGTGLESCLALAYEILASMGLSYNLYGDAHGWAYVVPRTQRASQTLDMKVGLSLPAGVLNIYRAPELEESYSVWVHRMRLEMQAVSARVVSEALEESCVTARTGNLAGMIMARFSSPLCE